MKPEMQRKYLSNEEQVKLINNYQSSSETADESLIELINNYKRLIRSISSEYAGQSFGLDKDIMGYGKLGFLKGVQTYDETKGMAPDTYITKKVRWEIIDGLREYMNSHEGRKKTYQY